jgi:long-subunit acyl-CoA synthetase (AMP-forming)
VLASASHSLGVYVAPGYLESLYASSDTVEQIFIYGNDSYSNVVAVVVPTEACLSYCTDALNHAFEYVDWLSGVVVFGFVFGFVFDLVHVLLVRLLVSVKYVDTIKTVILQSLSAIGLKEGLKAWEIPRVILVEFQKFTADNGLLSSIGMAREVNFVF